ncbi:MAG: hypothetical protein EHJ95_03245 [Methanobacteriota archaeon]|nr:MAG: hypothetical protein EHJ95_03245 [Euryarchaeota archaeon]
MISKGYTVIVVGLLAALLIAAVVVTAGCTSQGPPESGTRTVTYASTQATPLPKNVAIEVSAAAPTRLYLVEGGCKYETTVEVLNTGQIDYSNIGIRLDLVEGLLGSVRDTQNIPIERIVHGDRKIFTVQFSGDCDKQYRVRAEVS